MGQAGSHLEDMVNSSNCKHWTFLHKEEPGKKRVYKRGKGSFKLFDIFSY